MSGLTMLQKLTERANAVSFQRQRAEAMGFVFGHVTVEDDEFFNEFVMRGTFTCICGRIEQYKFYTQDSMHLELFDPAMQLRKHGFLMKGT